MKNGINFFNNASRSYSSKLHKNILSAKKPVDTNKKIFLSKKKTNNRGVNCNNRYYNGYNSKKNVSVSIGDDAIRTSFYKNIEIDKVIGNEKGLLINNSSFEYNEIINLLDKIMDKSDSYNILIKIKNFISSFIDEKEEKKSLNSSKVSYDNFPKNDIKYNTCKNMGRPRIMYKIENNKDNEKEEKFEEDKNIKLNDKDNNYTRNNYLNRRVKKLSDKLNVMEARSNIDKLKYLFFIVEQEKKIAELEKNFEVKEIPLNERIIDKMRELKCFPDLISNKFNQLNEVEKNNLLLKTRNKKEIKKNYTFDKDSEILPRKNHSAIIAQSERNGNNRKFQLRRF